MNKMKALEKINEIEESQCKKCPVPQRERSVTYCRDNCKYGYEIARLGKIYQGVKDVSEANVQEETVQAELTKEAYIYNKEKGVTDSKIRKDWGVHTNKLTELKREWGLIGVYGNKSEKAKKKPAEKAKKKPAEKVESAPVEEKQPVNEWKEKYLKLQSEMEITRNEMGKLAYELSSRDEEMVKLSAELREAKKILQTPAITGEEYAQLEKQLDDAIKDSDYWEGLYLITAETLKLHLPGS